MRLPFQPFSEFREVRIYHHGFLPHWRQDGCTYFVTFRLHDSIPQPVLDEWKYERDLWLAARDIQLTGPDLKLSLSRLSSRERRIFERHFAGRWLNYLDRHHGECLLQSAAPREIVVDALHYFDGTRLRCGDFAVMPNHVHWLVTPIAPHKLEDILHSIKSFTANGLNRLLGRSGSVWMSESYDRIVRDPAELVRTQSYIQMNPQKAGLKVSRYSLFSVEYDLSRLWS